MAATYKSGCMKIRFQLHRRRMANITLARSRQTLVAMGQPMALSASVHYRLNNLSYLMRPLRMADFTPNAALKMNGVIKVYQLRIFPQL